MAKHKALSAVVMAEPHSDEVFEYEEVSMVAQVSFCKSNALNDAHYPPRKIKRSLIHSCRSTWIPSLLKMLSWNQGYPNLLNSQ